MPDSILVKSGGAALPAGNRQPMRKTHSQDVFTALANAIVAGSIEPGQKLEERALARQFSVSRTPGREALRQLIGTGLAENGQRGGVTVARIDGHRLGDMFEALGELEGLCARLSAQRMTQIERQKLRLAEEACRQAASAEDAGAFASQNERFHHLIYVGTHNHSVAQITQAFRQRMAPFRVPTFYVIAGRARSSVEEHRAIVDAIVDGDGERSCQAMRSHVATTSVSVIDYFDKVRAGLLPAFSIRTAAEGGPARPELPVQG
jgi:DNA-binding GntR family transcriptional regulator